MYTLTTSACVEKSWTLSLSIAYLSVSTYQCVLTAWYILYESSVIGHIEEDFANIARLTIVDTDAFLRPLSLLTIAFKYTTSM